MHVIDAENVQHALFQGLDLLATQGQKRDSRNGEVLLMDDPVTTKYTHPRQRVLFWPAREANPFFHLFEGLWMLSGRRDVAPIAHYVKRMADFSDDGTNLHGAYGYRWLTHFLFDQLEPIIRRLKENPDDRRCVLQIWDADQDLDVNSKDIPCNTQVYFSRDLSGDLNMTVCCRSNDMIWGAYGANAVHFSMLQEFMAAGIGCPVGRYWQMSNNYHAYRQTFDPLLEALCRDRMDPTQVGNRYRGRVTPLPMVSISFEYWRIELHGFISGGKHNFVDPFFSGVAVPMRDAYNLYREGDLKGAINIAKAVRAEDWALAACEWLKRRLIRRGK